MSALGRYDGPHVKIAAIPDKNTMRLAQDVLHGVIVLYSETLVKDLRHLEAFCLQYNIPEQNRVTGQWITYRTCDPSLMSRYPQCTDWKTLQAETKRLQYAIDNFRTELRGIITTCVEAGARGVGDLTEASNIHDVHQAYVKLQGSFLQCKRCLFPMASKGTLIGARITWPKVQCTKNLDRCRTCNTSAFAKPTIPQSTVGNLNISQAMKDRRIRSMKSMRAAGTGGGQGQK